MNASFQSIRQAVRAISRAEWILVAGERSVRVQEMERLFRRWWEIVGVPATSGEIRDRRVKHLSPFIAAKRAAATANEKQRLEQVMRDAQGVVAAAARAVGIERRNFRRVLQRHGVDPAAFRVVEVTAPDGRSLP